MYNIPVTKLGFEKSLFFNKTRDKLAVFVCMAFSKGHGWFSWYTRIIQRRMGRTKRAI